MRSRQLLHCLSPFDHYNFSCTDVLRFTDYTFSTVLKVPVRLTSHLARSSHIAISLDLAADKVSFDL